ncbi:MAG: hypothetical protein ACU837_05260 [Gammaproteobacteria bacterium]
MTAFPVVTSREYKLILNGDRFGDREKECRTLLARRAPLPKLEQRTIFPILKFSAACGS